MVLVPVRRTLFSLLLLCSMAVPASAQQIGAMSGRVTDTAGGVLPGVTVEARSDVLPSPRVTVTEATGEYRLPALPPGNFTVTFTLSGMQTVTRQALVRIRLISRQSLVWIGLPSAGPRWKLDGMSGEARTLRGVRRLPPSSSRTLDRRNESKKWSH